MREALSNSWDANADVVNLNFSLLPDSSGRKKLMVEIEDDGDGIEESKIDDFFSLGESHKTLGSIGTKGHGTKIYYKSSGIKFESLNKAGQLIVASTESPPYETLKKGLVPTYGYDIRQSANTPSYMKIVIDGFDARPKDFSDPKELNNYILWHTIVGSIGSYFGVTKKMNVNFQLPDMPLMSVPFGFKLPKENPSLNGTSTKDFCKIFGPKTFEDVTQNGKSVKVEIIGAVMGEIARSKIIANANQMGIWVCKDYIKILQKNEYIQSVFSGRFYESSMLIFANCQQLVLTANRNDMLEETEEFEIAASKMKDFLKTIQQDPDYKAFQTARTQEEQSKKEEAKQKEETERKEYTRKKMKERMNLYRNRAPTGYSYGPVKEPLQEAEVALLLQSMIDFKHPGIDFKIGEYNTNYGPDLVVESENKGTHKEYFAEIVMTLEGLFNWPHPHEGYEKIICWKMGRVGVDLEFEDGKRGHLTNIGNGRHIMTIDEDKIDVYVLNEMIKQG